MGEKEKIIYKRDLCRGIVVLKPNTFYWRLRYWINQYGALIAMWIVKPIINWNVAFWRIREGEEQITGIELYRIGMIIQEDKTLLRLHFPFWIRNNRERLKKAFDWLRPS